MKDLRLTLNLAHIPLLLPWEHNSFIFPEGNIVYKAHDLRILFLGISWIQKVREITEAEAKVGTWKGDPLQAVDLTQFEGGPWKCVVTVHENLPMQFELTGPNNIKYIVANRSHAEVIMAALNALSLAEGINAANS